MSHQWYCSGVNDMMHGDGTPCYHTHTSYIHNTIHHPYMMSSNLGLESPSLLGDGSSVTSVVTTQLCRIAIGLARSSRSEVFEWRSRCLRWSRFVLFFPVDLSDFSGHACARGKLEIEVRYGKEMMLLGGDRRPKAGFLRVSPLLCA